MKDRHAALWSSWGPDVPLRHAANTHDVWFQIVFVRRPVRIEPSNQLPADIRAISTVSTFKQHLKTHLFNIAYVY